MSRRTGRIQRDLQQVTENPQPNIAVWPESDEELTARLTGPEDSPFAGGSFYLSIKFPDRYPFEPPHLTFKTPIHHPNIDSQGRICLDLLKLPPQGTWRPHINLSSCLTSILLLMTEPNPNDPLDPQIAEEFKSNRALFEQHAKQLTLKYAVDMPTKIDKDPLTKQETTSKSTDDVLTKSEPTEGSLRDGSNIQAPPALKTSPAVAKIQPLVPVANQSQQSQGMKNPVPPSDRPTQSQAPLKNPFAVLGKKPKH